MKVTCKHCGSENIVENNEVSVSYSVVEWEMRDGQLAVKEYGDSTAHWEGVRVDEEFPFRCRDCDADLAAGELVVAHD